MISPRERKRSFGFWLYPALTGLVILSLWYAAIEVFAINAFLLPPPHAVLQALVEYRADLIPATLATLSAALTGFLAAALGGYLTALLLAASIRIKEALYPWVLAFQMVPVVVLIPLFILWFGPGFRPIVLVTFTISFFPVVANSVMGLISTDRNHLDLFRSFNASKWQEIRYLRLPHSLPYFLTGLKIAATLAPIGAITGGMLAGTAEGFRGLGFLVIYYRQSIDAPGVLAVALLSCLLGFAFVGVVNLLSWALLHRWHASHLGKE